MDIDYLLRDFSEVIEEELNYVELGGATHTARRVKTRYSPGSIWFHHLKDTERPFFVVRSTDVSVWILVVPHSGPMMLGLGAFEEICATLETLGYARYVDEFSR